MKLSTHLAIAIITLTLPFNNANITKYRGKWTTCSEMWCPTQPDACRSMDTQLNCTRKGYVYDQNSPDPMHVIFIEEHGFISLKLESPDHIKLVETLLGSWNSYLTSRKLRQFQLATGFDGTGKLTCPNKFTQQVLLDLDNLPRLETVSTVTISINCVSDIVGNISNTFPNIEYLTCRTYSLKKVPENIRMLSGLKKLNLVANEIEQVPHDILQNLTSLQDLFFSRNSIKELPQDLFQYNVELTLVDLSRNALKTVPAKLFANNKKLRVLQLNFNSIEYLPEELLNGLTRLQSFYAIQNKLTSLPENFFRSTRESIQHIELNYNQLIEVPVIKATTAELISFRGNNITVLHVPLLDRVGHTFRVVFSDNCIQSINSSTGETPEETEKIHFLDCENCCFTSIPVDLASEVQVLNLARNKIEAISMIQLEQLSIWGFEKLDLRYNLMRHADFLRQLGEEFYFYSVPYSYSILLERNPMICDCNFVFLDGLQNNNFTKDILKPFDIAQWQCTEPKTGKRIRIKYLDIEKLYCEHIQSCPDKCQCYEYTDTNTLLINCTGVGLTEFPTVLPNISNSEYVLNLDYNNIDELPSTDFFKWNKIKEINLAHNRLTSVASLAPNPFLTKVQLDGNMLTQFEKSLLNILNYSSITTSVTLSENPWKCTCDVKAILHSIDNNEFVSDRQNVVCQFEGVQYTIKDVEQICLLQHTVTDSDTKIILPIMLSLCILLFAFLSLVFYFRSQIKRYLYVRGICSRFITEKDMADGGCESTMSYRVLQGEGTRERLVNTTE